MTDTLTQDSPDDLPAQLAAAGAGELAAAAAIDAEEGDKFLQALLADQMAAEHLLTMRLAAAADRAISAAADSAGRSEDNLPLFDLAAARFAGAAARTRAGCGCRQPAMANGRCRFHGGKSTGARTEAGRGHACRARLVHGMRSAEAIALSAAAAAAHRRMGTLIAAVSRPHEVGEGRGGGAAAKLGAPAGHGVDRSESNITAGSATILPFTRPTPVRSPCRNRLPRVRS